VSSVAPLGHRPGLDGIRGLAVLAVAVFHTELGWLPGAWVSVNSFFVLSGFLITTLLLEEHQRFRRIDLRAFYARRALRLLPALLALLAAVTAVATVGIVAKGALSGAPWVLGYVANWGTAGGRRFGPLTHLWTLSVEEQFYILWPLALLALLRWVPSARHRAMVVGGAALAIALARCGLFYADVISADRAYFGSDMRFDGLLVGCVIGMARHEGWTDRISRVVRRLCWPSVVVLVGVGLSRQGPLGGLAPLLCAPVDLAAGVVVLTAASTSSLRALRWRPLVHLGVLSYALYLWHVPVMFLIDLTPTQRLVVGFPLTYAAALVSRWLVEQPALRFKRHLSPRDLGAAEHHESGLGGEVPRRRWQSIRA
jgi:peptidoglycan/LPS O-acetylase OafA/YrhL